MQLLLLLFLLLLCFIAKYFVVNFVSSTNFMTFLPIAIIIVFASQFAWVDLRVSVDPFESISNIVIHLHNSFNVPCISVLSSCLLHSMAVLCTRRWWWSSIDVCSDLHGASKEAHQKPQLYWPLYTVPRFRWTRARSTFSENHISRTAMEMSQCSVRLVEGRCEEKR